MEKNMLKNLVDILYLVWIYSWLVLGIIFILPAVAILPFLGKWRNSRRRSDNEMP